MFVMISTPFGFIISEFTVKFNPKFHGKNMQFAEGGESHCLNPSATSSCRFL